MTLYFCFILAYPGQMYKEEFAIAKAASRRCGFALPNYNLYGGEWIYAFHTAEAEKSCLTFARQPYAFDYFPGLKLSFRLTERLKTRWPGAQSLESGQK